MKKIYTLLLMALLPVCVWSAGWPTNYGGVMLQGFYWNSFDDTSWANFMEDIDELTDAFDLIWIPNTGKVDATGTAQGMGYTPLYWFDHNNCFGTENELREMIQQFRARGTGFIMDAVLNHKNGETDWVDFANERVKGRNTGKIYKVMWDNEMHTQICSGDECVAAGYPVHGAADTGENFDGCRDLDHTNVTTQLNVKTYLDFLLHELGYAGFRYDETKGYAPGYTAMYDFAAKPMFAVGEYWDGNADVLRWWLESTKYYDQIQSGTFDYCLKYRINDAFNNGNWGALNDKGLAADANYSRWAITFLDNHDTGRDGYQMVSRNVAAANALLLALPGTPCLFLPHWKQYKNEIKNCILGRRAAGIHNMSIITKQQESNGGYILEVEGTKGKVYLQLGGAISNAIPTGYQLVQSGTNYKFFVTKGLDWQHAPKNGILPGTPYATPYPGNNKITVFVKAQDPNSSRLYAWDSNENYIDRPWPGTVLNELPYTYVGGAKWYYKTFDQSKVNVILNNSYSGSTCQTADIKNITQNIFLDYPWTDGNCSIYSNVTTKYAPYANYEIPATAEVQEGKVYCYLETNEITTPYIYTWDCLDNRYSANWNGTKMTQVGVAPNGKKIYRWTGGDYNVDSIPQFVIFNDGKNNGKQTADLDFVNGGYYTLDGLIATVPGHEDPVEIADVYVMGDVNDVGGWYANKGYKMTSTDGVIYTANVVTRGQNAGYSYFSFSKQLADAPTDWESIARYRFGAYTTEENLLVTNDMVGTELPLGADGSTSAFQIGAGEWKFTLNLNERTLVIDHLNLIRGDVNGDGKVNVSDVTKLVNVILGIESVDAMIADVNGDGRVNVSDLATIINIILGIA